MLGQPSSNSPSSPTPNAGSFTPHESSAVMEAVLERSDLYRVNQAEVHRQVAEECAHRFPQRSWTSNAIKKHIEVLLARASKESGAIRRATGSTSDMSAFHAEICDFASQISNMEGRKKFKSASGFGELVYSPDLEEAVFHSAKMADDSGVFATLLKSLRKEDAAQMDSLISSVKSMEAALARLQLDAAVHRAELVELIILILQAVKDLKK